MLEIGTIFPHYLTKSIRLLVYFSLSQNVYLRILFLSKFYSKRVNKPFNPKNKQDSFNRGIPPDLCMNFFSSHIQIKGSIAWFNIWDQCMGILHYIRLQCLTPSASIHLKQRKRWNQSENKRFNLTIKPVASFELFNTFC